MIYDLFISHSWSYKEAYEKLLILLDDARYFKYRNYSIPKDDPIRINSNNNDYYRFKLREGIRAKIKGVSVVIIMAGVYSSYSDTIQMEIDIAQEFGKPILAIEPWASEKTSKVVKENSSKIVAWNTSSIVEAIRELVKNK